MQGMASEEMMSVLRSFAVDVAENWRDAKPEAISAMVEIAKLDTQLDKLTAMIEKLSAMDVF